MFSDRNAAHPVRCDIRLADSISSLAQFLNLNLLGWVWQPTADNSGSLASFNYKNKKYNKRPLPSAAGCHTRPDQTANTLK
jgi:hypothetical protein